jgi:hypothetical protein
MHVPINVKSPNNISEWQRGFNSAFKGLNIKKSNKYKKNHTVGYTLTWERSHFQVPRLLYVLFTSSR